MFAGNTRPFGSNSSPAVEADNSTLTNVTTDGAANIALTNSTLVDNSTLSTTNQTASIDETALVETSNVTEIAQPLMNAPSTNMTGNDQQNSTISSPSGMFTPSPMGDSGSQIASIDLTGTSLCLGSVYYC